jgi:hypothetical protein
MLAVTVTFDLIFVVHILIAVAAIAVFVVLRTAGAAVANGAAPEEQAKKFPVRRNWAARLFHLLPVTGLALVGLGGASMSFSQPWIGGATLAWLLAAGHLEARVLPDERSLATTIARDGVAPPAAGKRFGLSVDVLLSLVAVALVLMVWQP